MSTKKETTSTATQKNTYNPAGMSAYNQLQPQIYNSLRRGMGDHNELMNAWMQKSNQAIGQIGNRMNSNMYANARTSGFQSNNPFMQASLARNSRAVSGMQGNAFLQSLFQNEDLKRLYTGMAQGYQPLQTGGTQTGKSTETTGGTGSWLPQVVGAAISGAAGVATGGMSTIAQGAGSLMGGTQRLPLGQQDNAGGMNPFMNSFWNSNPNASALSASSWGGGSGGGYYH